MSIESMVYNTLELQKQYSNTIKYYSRQSLFHLFLKPCDVSQSKSRAKGSFIAKHSCDAIYKLFEVHI